MRRLRPQDRITMKEAKIRDRPEVLADGTVVPAYTSEGLKPGEEVADHVWPGSHD